MKVITAVEAGKRLGVSERTVRYWIEKGIIQTFRPSMPDGSEKKNRLAIPEDEINRILQERQQYEYARPGEAPASELAVILQRLAVLEQEVQLLKLREHVIAASESHVAPSTPRAQLIAPQRTPEPRSATLEPVQTISGDMIPLRLFVAAHGLKSRTVSDHIHDDKIQATKREDAPQGQDKWFFSPEQQREAVIFWQEHHTPGFHLCEHCPHTL